MRDWMTSRQKAYGSPQREDREQVQPKLDLGIRERKTGQSARRPRLRA